MGGDTSESQGIVFANREEPIPVIHVSPDDEDLNPTIGDEAKTGVRSMLKGQTDKIKDMFGGDGSSENKFSLQDRLFATIMSQIIPTDGMQEAKEEPAESGKGKKDKKSKKMVSIDKPDFGPRLMAINFRRFNARIGGLFAAQKGVEDLFTWKYPTITMTFLAGHTFLCLNPHLLPVIPLTIGLFLILVPAFLARHPTPENDPRIEPSYVGPPTAPPVVLKPAPDLSSDFWRNARDLQNTMEDVAHLFDLLNTYITPLFNFSDEATTSTIFLAIFLLTCVALLGAHLIPYQLVLLIGGWGAFLAGNPRLQKIIAESQKQTSQNSSALMQHVETIQIAVKNWIDHDIVLDAPEIRQVEIFELQRFRDADETWEPWLFSPAPFVPLSQARAAGQRPKGTQFFEDVQPPAGWIWKEKKWGLDLISREWVEQRLITGVEVETQGDRWVYDIPPEEVELLESSKRKKKSKAVPKSGWEEGTGNEKRGEWRRRRWTRLVVKKSSIRESKAPEET